jgi:glycine cleavage system H protein
MAALKVPENLKYARSDEWVLLDGETATLGISDYAQDQLNDIVFVELPSVGATINAGETFGAVESVKAASDLYSPISGVVTEVNAALEKQPEILNSDPYEKGWIVKLKVTDSSGAASLMDAGAYQEFNKTR